MKKLLAYDYKGVKHRGGVYHPKEVNLGDYIQTLAAKRFYDVFGPKKKYEELDLIDRDSLLSAENSDFIANGWYVLSDENHLWPDSADPLLVSIHIKNREGFPRVLEKLKDSSHKRPIGCRDLATLNFLKGEGVEAYFSSCLTTTLQREDWTDKKDEERSGVVFSDVAPEMMTYSPLISRGVFKQLKPSLKYNFLNFCYRLFNDRCDLSLYENEDVRLVTHEMTKESTHADRFREAEKLLKTFAEARLVITSRIHCALPCLALGTPVILIATYDKYRYQGLEDFFNHIYVDEKSNRILKYKIEMKNGEVINSEKYKPYAQELEEVCMEYMKHKEE